MNTSFCLIAVYEYLRIWTILKLSKHFFHSRFVRELERRIAGETKNCMRIPHSSYRSFATEKRLEPANGFVDGDLVESILDLPRETVGKIVENLKMPEEQGDAVF